MHVVGVLFVGDLVGEGVDCVFVGDDVLAFVGADVGSFVGIFVGFAVGDSVGFDVGLACRMKSGIIRLICSRMKGGNDGGIFTRTLGWTFCRAFCCYGWCRSISWTSNIKCWA